MGLGSVTAAYSHVRPNRGGVALRSRQRGHVDEEQLSDESCRAGATWHDESPCTYLFLGPDNMSLFTPVSSSLRLRCNGNYLRVGEVRLSTRRDRQLSTAAIHVPARHESYS